MTSWIRPVLAGAIGGLVMFFGVHIYGCMNPVPSPPTALEKAENAAKSAAEAVEGAAEGAVKEVEGLIE